MNFDLSTAADKVQAKREHLEEWERGVERPSIPQARRYASVPGLQVRTPS
jgi:DNA-binding XRE family transcriptional regulator